MSVESRWPAVTYETRAWKSRDDLPASRRDRLRARHPYRASVTPRIARRKLSLPSHLVAACEDASNEIARFDSQLGSEIAPFTAVLLRSESAASSRIENLTASARAIAEAQLGLGVRNGALIVANERAMTAAIALADRLDRRTILAMHDALLRMSAPAIAGRLRIQQVWIGGSHFSPHDAEFVPPHHTLVSEALDDLIAFLKRTDLPILAHAAVAHAQFETVHPFVDGNGRVGRALVHAQLRHARLTNNVTVPVSAGLLSDVRNYFDGLKAYREGNPVPIVEQFANASFAALDNGRRLVADLQQLRTEWSGRVRARRGATAWRVLDVVLRAPVVSAAFLGRELGLPPSNVYRALDPLVDADVLVEFGDKKRDRLWRAPEVLAALDAFSARAGRRQRRR